MKQSAVLIALVMIMVMAVPAVYAQSYPGVSFRQEGIASWYGPGFEGKPTASGETYDSAQFTAAHPFVPFGTILTVTNTFNKLRVNVRINDRGPFTADRVIDLSRVAAEVLDMVNTGTAAVIVELASNSQIGPFSAAPADNPAALIIGGIPQTGTGKHYRLQIGAYKVPRHAVDAFERLKNAGLNPAYERIDDIYRVVLSMLTPEEIPSVAEQLFSIGFVEAIIREE